MGRRKIEIQPITHERNRSVTFLKRKNGLFKKAYELGVLCSVDVAVIIFEERAGHHVKLYEYCSTDIDSMVQRHTHFEGEKDARSPTDFNNKPDDGGDDDDDPDDDDHAGKRRDSIRAAGTANKLKRDGGKMVPVIKDQSNNIAMSMDMEYRQHDLRQMALPQAPLHHLPLPAGSAAYTGAALPVSIERHTPVHTGGNGGGAPPNKKPRIDATSYPYMDDTHAHSPTTYRMPSQMFPQQTQHQQGSGGNGTGSAGSPGSPPSHFFTPLAFSQRGQPPQSPTSQHQHLQHHHQQQHHPHSQRQQHPQHPQQQQQQQQQSFPPPSYGLYPPANPFAALLAPTHGAGTHAAHAATSFEPLDWPVHADHVVRSSSASGSASAGSAGTGSTAPTGGPGGSAFQVPARPQSQPASAPGAVAGGGGTAGVGAGGGGGPDTSWLDFLSGAAPPPQPSTTHHHQGPLHHPQHTPQPGQGQQRRADDAWERGSHHSTHSQHSQHSQVSGGGASGLSLSPPHAGKRARADSSSAVAPPPVSGANTGGAGVKEDSDSTPGAGKVKLKANGSVGNGSASGSGSASGTATAGGGSGKDADARSDASGSAGGGGDRKRQRWGDL